MRDLLEQFDRKPNVLLRQERDKVFAQLDGALVNYREYTRSITLRLTVRPSGTGLSTNRKYCQNAGAGADEIGALVEMIDAKVRN